MVDEALPPPSSPARGLVNIFEEVLRLAGTDGGAESAAAESIGRISPKELEEIRTLRSPPPVVRRTLEATFLLLNAANATGPLAPPAWPRVQKMLADTAFLVRMREYDPESLKSAPALTSYIASEYFGEGGGAKRRSRSSSKSASLLSGSEVLRSPARGSVHRSFAAFGARIVGQDQLDEPLTFKRVSYASRAAGALFGWCTATLVDALELPMPVSTPPPSTPPPAEPAQLSEEALNGRAPAQPPTPPALAPTPPRAPPSPPPLQPASPVPLPAPAPVPAPAPAAPPSALPAVARGPALALASAAEAAAAGPRHLPGTTQPLPAPEPPKRQPAEVQEPDRHFELLCGFEMGYSGLTDDGVPPLQTVAAVMCMRKQLTCELLGCPADIENNALNISRMQAVEAFFQGVGIHVDRSPDSPRTTTIDGTPGVICQVHLKRDRELKDYFILREECDEFQINRHTRSVIETLESEFETYRHT